MLRPSPKNGMIEHGSAAIATTCTHVGPFDADVDGIGATGGGGAMGVVDIARRACLIRSTEMLAIAGKDPHGAAPAGREKERARPAVGASWIQSIHAKTSACRLRPRSSRTHHATEAQGNDK